MLAVVVLEKVHAQVLYCIVLLYAHIHNIIMITFYKKPTQENCKAYQNHKVWITVTVKKAQNNKVYNSLIMLVLE